MATIQVLKPVYTSQKSTLSAPRRTDNENNFTSHNIKTDLPEGLNLSEFLDGVSNLYSGFHVYPTFLQAMPQPGTKRGS